MSRSNKDAKASAESEEGRPLIKENIPLASTHSTQSEARVSQGLMGARQAAKQRKEMKFTASEPKGELDRMTQPAVSMTRLRLRRSPPTQIPHTRL